MADSNFDEDFDDLLAEDTLSVDADDLEVEIDDDTPEADRGKPDNPDDLTDTSDDEVMQYSAKVQKRIDKLTAQANTERRAREKLSREHEEAVRTLQGVMTVKQQLEQERHQLRKQLSQGESVYVKEVIGSLEAQLAGAQDKFRKAYENGLTDDLVAAQTDIAAITHRMQLAKNYTPEQYTEDVAPVVPVKAEAPRPQPDAVFVEWRGRNQWFDDPQHAPMKALAMAVHGELINRGVHPTLDAATYYKAIDTQMRKRFPEYRWPDVQRNKGSSTPGNSASSSSRKNQVRLTQSEVSLAASLGLTAQQYAAEKIKLERSRGR
jgi:hypothetical protein